MFHNDGTQLLSSHSLDLSSSESDWNNLLETRTTGVHPTMKMSFSVFTHHHSFIHFMLSSFKKKKKKTHHKNIPFDFSFKINIIDLWEVVFQYKSSSPRISSSFQLHTSTSCLIQCYFNIMFVLFLSILYFSISTFLISFCFLFFIIPLILVIFLCLFPLLPLL